MVPEGIEITAFQLPVWACRLYANRMQASKQETVE
jgi:hypothetical protein